MSKKYIKPISKRDEEFGLRPIGARALKSAMDTLRPHFNGASVLDLYAGQGRFGLAAAREGIASLTCIEKNPHSARDLKAECAAKSFPKGVSWQVRPQDVFSFLNQAKQTYDIVFADPPFAEWNLPFESKLLHAVLKVLTPSSILLVKHPTRVVASDEFKGLKLWKQTEFGESRLLYFEVEP